MLIIHGDKGEIVLISESDTLNVEDNKFINKHYGDKNLLYLKYENTREGLQASEKYISEVKFIDDKWKVILKDIPKDIVIERGNLSELEQLSNHVLDVDFRVVMLEMGM